MNLNPQKRGKCIFLLLSITKEKILKILFLLFLTTGSDAFEMGFNKSGNIAFRGMQYVFQRYGDIQCPIFPKKKS